MTFGQRGLIIKDLFIVQLNLITYENSNFN